jgi:hypothetical protein
MLTSIKYVLCLVGLPFRSQSPRSPSTSTRSSPPPSRKSSSLRPRVASTPSPKSSASGDEGDPKKKFGDHYVAAAR